MNAKKNPTKNNVNEIYNIIQLKLLNLLHNFALTGSLGHETFFSAPLTKKAKKYQYTGDYKYIFLIIGNKGNVWKNTN